MQHNYAFSLCEEHLCISDNIQHITTMHICTHLHTSFHIKLYNTVEHCTYAHHFKSSNIQHSTTMHNFSYQITQQCTCNTLANPHFRTHFIQRAKVLVGADMIDKIFLSQPTRPGTCCHIRFGSASNLPRN